MRLLITHPLWYIQKISLVILSYCLVSMANAQQNKPMLPAGYFNSFNYSLPTGFDYNDSAQVVNEVFKIASEVRNYHINALLTYRLADSAAWYNFLDRTIAVNAVLGLHQDVAEAIITCRRLKKAFSFEAPYRLSQLAYSKACVAHADDGSDVFKNKYAEMLSAQFHLIDAAFRNDIVNRQKGLTTPEITPLYWNNLKRLLEYAVTKNNSKLAYNTAQHDIIPTYHAYNQSKKYRPLIDSVLYALSPSRIKTEKVSITMRDGIRLSAYIYKDSVAANRLPAIIAVSPYPGGGGDPIKGNIFASNGYIYVYADARGRGESEGNFTPFENDAQDFYDIIDWVSRQPYCNGKVATSGSSYLGFSQWQAIRTQYRHPALKAINPIVSVGFGIDFPAENNIFYPFALQWAVYTSGKQPNYALYTDSKFWRDKNYELYKKRLPFAKLDSIAGLPNPVFQKWIAHPYFDHYWENILPSPADYKTMDMPVLSITGYYDGDQTGAMYYFNQHQQHGSLRGKNNHYLLIGPYDHGGAQWLPANMQGGYEIEPNAMVPLYKYIIWWFDWVLKGKKKPDFLQDKITFFETGNNNWNGTGSFEKLTTDSLVLYLTNKKVPNTRRKDLYLLHTEKPGPDDVIKYTHDISEILDSAYLFSSSKTSGDSIYMAASNNLIFESGPLAKDMLISNRIISNIYLSLNVPDADFEILVNEITPAGTTHVLANGKMRARYRNSSKKAELVKPGEVVLLGFDDMHIYIRKINKGSKIRLIFQSVNTPMSEKNWGFGGEVSKQSSPLPRIIEATIHMNSTYKSNVIIPYK